MDATVTFQSNPASETPAAGSTSPSTPETPTSTPTPATAGGPVAPMPLPPETIYDEDRLQRELENHQLFGPGPWGVRNPHIQGALQRELDQELGQPMKPPPKQVLKNLKLPAAAWNAGRLLAVDKFGKWATPKRVSQLNLVEAINQLQRLEKAQDLCEKVAAEIDTKTEKDEVTKTMLTALKLIPELALAHQRVADHLLKMSERSHVNEASDKRRNLPPMFQVNVGGNGPVTVASSATGDREVPSPAALPSP